MDVFFPMKISLEMYMKNFDWFDLQTLGVTAIGFSINTIMNSRANVNI